MTKLSICLYNYNLLLINKNNTYIYIYNKIFYFTIITKFYVFVEENSNAIIIENFDSKKKKELEKKIIETFIKTWNVYFFQKIKFTGKGYKIKKKKKSIKFFFGRSHLTTIFFKKISIKRLTKYKLFFFTKKYETVKFINSLIKKIRKINIYTKRGLRFSRQKIYKKTGKKSSYM
jgi:ribosomal protein L6P/L9E